MLMAIENETLPGSLWGGSVATGAGPGGPGGSEGIASPVLFLLGLLCRDSPCGGWVDGSGELGVVAHPVAVAADVDDVSTVHMS